MRVALCFSGQLRSVQDTYEQWWKPNVLDVNQHHQIDVFGHSWFDKTTVGTVYYASNPDPFYQKASKEIPTNVIQQVYDAYNPVQLLLEQQLEFDDKNYNDRKLPGAIPKNGISRLYSIYRANALKRQYEEDNHFRYDVVVCARYDFIIREPMLFDSVTEYGIYHLGYSPHGFNVCHAMGQSQAIDLYAELYYHYDDVFRMGNVWADETISLGFMRAVNLPVHDLHIPNGINRG